MTDITVLLAQAAEGHTKARDSVLEALQRELHRIASQAMRRERPDHTLQPTALVNEAWLRLVAKPVAWESRAEFLRASSRVMREILVDHARKRGTVKRGGDWQKLPITDPIALAEFEPEKLLAIEDALTRLAEHDSRARQVVELRYFGGLTIEETAQVLDVAVKTVTRDWHFARAWLESELTA